MRSLSDVAVTRTEPGVHQVVDGQAFLGLVSHEGDTWVPIPAVGTTIPDPVDSLATAAAVVVAATSDLVAPLIPDDYNPEDLR